MTSELDLRGTFVPLITPFTETDAVAYDEVERLAADALDAGAAGIVALGTTGEPATLDEEEKKKVFEIVGAVCKDRGAHFNVGAGTNSTRTSIGSVEAACEAGADSILAVVPYYTRPSEAGIVSHFETLASVSDAPLIVYNIPYRTGRGLGADSLLHLASVPNIAGLKQAVGGVDADTLRLFANKPEAFQVVCGDDPYIFPLLSLGASGAIAASANVCTSAFVALVDAALKDEDALARRLHETLLPLCTALFEEPSPAVIKALLHASGKISTPNLRAPMTAASAKATTKAVEVFAAVNDVLASL
jgi:4-hydroxy-tetrahydrodipicolinate synthase